MLIKRTERPVRRGTLAGALQNQASGVLDRRSFLRRSGLVAGSLATLGALPLASVRKAQAGPPPPAGAQVTIRKSICTHCSVGCTVVAEVANGVWIGQEPGWESPINRGSHCAKGASVRELVHGDRRLRYPMKLVNGQWTRVSWDVAINEIGDKLTAIRAKSGPDSVYWLGSAKMTNEGSYLFRKMGAFWGTNNTDHQARICHSTTVTGVANTWGYGAMTNSYTDIRNSKTMVFLGGNPAEAHPVSLQHLIEGKELNRANYIVIDPRLTRTAAHATEYVRMRPGTDIPILWGMLWHIFKNGWEDKEYIRQRVYGMDEVRKEVEKWNPEEVERVSGVPGEQLKRVAEKFAKERPSTLIWAMGQTQHTVGTANVRASCILLLATGNVGVMAATNEEVKAKEYPILGWVFVAVILMCLLTFRSVLGTLLVFLPLALVSILVYAVMAIVGIGLKVNTLPMVALGAGIGVDYGIYLWSRMQEYLEAGDNVHDAYLKTMRVTGASIIFTGITLAIGVVTWVFSPLQFQADIGIMLTFMFFVNMLGAIILLPALAAWFIKGRDASTPAAPAAPTAAAG